MALTNLFVPNVALIWVHMICTLVIFFMFSCRRQTDETLSSLSLSLPLQPLHFLQMRSSPTNSLWLSKLLRLQTILLLWIKLLQYHGHASLQDLLVGSNRLNIKFCKPGNKSGRDFYCWSNISNMRRSVSSPPDETPRRELKIRRAAEYFWRTSRCFIWWWNTSTIKVPAWFVSRFTEFYI